MAKSEGLTTKEILAALRERFALPAFALFTEVGDATGFAKSRSADALAMSCWPSRGLDLYGFEIKVSRGDWKKELDNPAKAESVCRYCDFWYVCCGATGIVKDGELPPTWGLMEPRGRQLVTRNEAPRLNAEEWDRGFLAALLRRAAQTHGEANAVEAARKEGFDDGHGKGYDVGIKDGERRGRTETSRQEGELRRLRELEREVAAFREASGLELHPWSAGRALGELVKRFAHATPEALVSEELTRAEVAARELLRIVATARGTLPA